MSFDTATSMSFVPALIFVKVAAFKYHKWIVWHCGRMAYISFLWTTEDVTVCCHVHTYANAYIKLEAVLFSLLACMYVHTYVTEITSDM